MINIYIMEVIKKQPFYAEISPKTKKAIKLFMVLENCKNLGEALDKIMVKMQEVKE